MGDTPTVAGFCGLKRGGAGPNPPMSTDPNADLIGMTFPVDTGGEGIVVGSCRWNSAYVEITTGAGPTLRVAAQVRRRKELLA
jgi:hypothetical protein